MTNPLVLYTRDGRAYGSPPYPGESGIEYEKRMGLEGCNVDTRPCHGECLGIMRLHALDPQRKQVWCLACGTLDQ